MVRVKRGAAAKKRKKNVLKNTKGFRWGRKSKYKQAKEALLHAWKYAYRDRRNKKRDMRRAWQIRINAAARENGIPYNQLIHKMKENKIDIDRKILSDFAANNPDIFKKIAEKVK